MSGRPDHAAAPWRGESVDEAGGVPVVDGSPAEVVETAEGYPASGERGVVAPDGPHVVEDDGPDLTDVGALMAQRDEYLDSLQRLKADFDNYRKRVARLQQEQSARAEANLVTKLLPVLDNLDLAWAHLGPGTDEGEPASEEARAIGQARAQLLDVLGREGLERVDTVGVPFDPTVHDAVAHSESAVTGAASASASATDDDAEGNDGGVANGSIPHVVSVDGVLRAGYRWRGQVLRPAMVQVRG